MSFKISSYTDVPEDTPVEDIPGKVARTVAGFRSHKTIPLEFRKEQLRNLYYGIQDNLDLFYDVLFKDLHKGKLEADTAELAFILKEINYFIDNLDELAKPEKVPIDLTARPASASIYRQPFGTVLVISPWNFPVVLSISPLAAAIAAGNTVVLKCSELTPHTARAMIKVLETYLDPEIFTGVTGAIPQSTALLAEKFDKILYTGNGVVGRIVSKAAAQHLTPVVLELGGKSPVIITKSADLRLAARRVLWGKLVNSGQTCVAPDYILIEASVKPKFTEELLKAYKEYFPVLTPETSYTHIVSDRHFERLKGILDKSQGTIVVGGQTNAAARFIAPTVLDNVTASDSVMRDEIFGPFIGMITVQNVDEAIDFIVKEHDTPLALYIFSTNKAEQEYILSRTRSGGGGINDPLMHVGLLNAPFGGFGQSGGGGGYHGKAGFDVFTHTRTVFNQSSIIERVLSMRYPPYTKSKEDMAHGFLFGKPWFPRTGPVRRHLLLRLLSKKFMWITLLVAVAAGKYQKIY